MLKLQQWSCSGTPNQGLRAKVLNLVLRSQLKRVEINGGIDALVGGAAQQNLCIFDSLQFSWTILHIHEEPEHAPSYILLEDTHTEEMKGIRLPRL
ncbi:hypothetical protein HDU76_004964, partial [Blyttiomyces sp. JEL0837]